MSYVAENRVSRYEKTGTADLVSMAACGISYYMPRTGVISSSTRAETPVIVSRHAPAYGLKLYHGIRPAVSHIVTILSGQNISKPGGAAQISMWCFRTQQLITTVCTYPARQSAPSIGCVVHRSGASSCLHEAKADACPNP